MWLGGWGAWGEVRALVFEGLGVLGGGEDVGC